MMIKHNPSVLYHVHEKSRYYFLSFFIAISCMACAGNRTGQNTTVPISIDKDQHVERDRYNRLSAEQFRKNDSMISALRAITILKRPQEIPEFIWQLNGLELEGLNMKKSLYGYRYINEKEWLNFRREFSRQLEILSASITRMANWWD